MNATLIIEHRFQKTANGNVYATNSSINTKLWNRYLESYTHLTVLARIQEVQFPDNEKLLVTHHNVTFAAIPYYIGPKQFLKKYTQIKKVIKTQVKKDQAYICRLPSILGTLLIKRLRKKNIPYVVEVVSDPWDIFAPYTFKTSLLLFHRFRGALSLKRNIKNAKGVIYVSQALENRYPAHKKASVAHVSDVILKKDKNTAHPKTFNEEVECFHLLAVGSLAQMYKAPDVVLKAIKKLKDKGINIHLTWLGDGQYKKDMLQLRDSLNLTKEVTFSGNVSSDEVENQLKKAHIFLHVSRAEGMPRALIEAMAQGLPCIGTKIGGIPELLHPNALINKNSVHELYLKMVDFVNHKEKLNFHAEHNWKKVQEFDFKQMNSKRKKVYNTLLKQNK